MEPSARGVQTIPIISLRCVRTRPNAGAPSPACTQALLAAWRAELSRQPLSLSEADACATLGLKPPPGGGPIAEEELRRAYRSLARKWVRGRPCEASHGKPQPEGGGGFRAHKAVLPRSLVAYLPAAWGAVPAYVRVRT